MNKRLLHSDGKHIYEVFWYEGEYVGVCHKYPSLSGFGPTVKEALAEIKKIVLEGEDLLEKKDINNT